MLAWHYVAPGKVGHVYAVTPRAFSEPDERKYYEIDLFVECSSAR